MEHFDDSSPEERMLRKIFGEEQTWKGKSKDYNMTWCGMCRVFVISCDNCRNGSCNGGGCDECREDFGNFGKDQKISPLDYLNEAEREIYFKIEALKGFIPKSLALGQKEIDWQALETAGELSNYDHRLFPEETKDLIPYEFPKTASGGGEPRQ